MADKKKNRVKAEQLHIALIWKYQLGSQKKNVCLLYTSDAADE